MERWSLRVRFFLFFLGLAVGGVLIVAMALWYSQSRSEAPVNGYVIAGVISGFGIIGLVTWIGFLFDQNIAKPIMALASDLETRAKVDVNAEIDSDAARYLGALAPAAQTLHKALEKTRMSLSQDFSKKLEGLSKNQRYLEYLLKELADGVVVMSADGRVLLYNRAALGMLGALGLNRPLTSFIHTDPIIDAIHRLELHSASEEQAFLSFLTTDRTGKVFFLGSVSNLILEHGQLGHVLLLRNVTENLCARTRMERSLRDLNVDVIQDKTLNAGQWPISALPLQNLFEAFDLQVAEPVQVVASDFFVKCDAFAMIALCREFQRELVQNYGASHFHLSAVPKDNIVQLVLTCMVKAPVGDMLERWLSHPLDPAYGHYSRRDILHAHRHLPEIVERDGQVQFILPMLKVAGPAKLKAIDVSEFYDFKLPSPEGCDFLDRPLNELSFVVFDTETTGLDRNSDQVVQIAGVRILAGRLLRGENFDELVNPGRKIPAGTTKIHGITNAMVKDARFFSDVSLDFNHFAEGSVFVAHNAAFDMAFLKRQSKEGGPEFAHPVLCTAQLSARLFPHTGDHTLDGLAKRFGIEIPEDCRHTALGDSIATAELFLKMMALLETQDVTNLKQALAFQHRPIG